MALIFILQLRPFFSQGGIVTVNFRHGLAHFLFTGNYSYTSAFQFIIVARCQEIYKRIYTISGIFKRNKCQK